MKISSAEFLKSSEKVSQCPSTGLPEYAFIGRSNVGKSSLINMLTGQGKLSKVSSTPGKTKLINHFLINKVWYLVDLPGYGYSKTSKSVRNEFSKLITSYVAERTALSMLFVLIDSRLEPQGIDLRFMSMLGQMGVPFGIILTKADKISASAQKASRQLLEQTLLQEWEELPPIFATSSVTHHGQQELLEYIHQVNEMIRLNNTE